MSKSKKSNKFSKEVKSEVLEMLKDPEYSVTEVARAYSISTSTLHKWKARMNQQRSISSSASSLSTPSLSSASSPSGFVEVAIVDSKNVTKVIKKASMVFDDMSISIEGKISSKDLMSVISILESSC